MKSNYIIGIVIVLIIVIAGVWYATTNPAIASELGLRHGSNNSSGTNMGSTTPRYGMRGGFAQGSIEVLNDSGFTMTLQDGTTKVVTITATTTLQNYAAASSTPTTITADQLSVGESVFVMGTTESDGSIAARRVTTGVLPMMGQGRMGGHGAYGMHPGGQSGSGSPTAPTPTQ